MVVEVLARFLGKVGETQVVGNRVALMHLEMI